MKERSIILVFFLILGLGQIFAQKNQNEVKIKRSELKTDNKEGFTDAWLAVVEADAYFEQGVGTYNLARDLYLSAHQYNSENPELNYLIGVCYLYTDDKYEAINYLRKAYEKKPGISPEINYLIGRAYHLVLEFDKAVEHYNAYIKTLKTEEISTKVPIIDKLISECHNGKNIVKDPKRLIITNLGDSINSLYDDYNSVFASGDSAMYFTSRRPLKVKSKRNPYDNKFFEDVYFSSLSEAGWSFAVPMEKKINSKSNEAVVGISNDTKQLFVYKGNEKGGEIYASDYNNESWKSLKPWLKRLSSDQSESSLFFTQTGDTVYFISSNEKLTIGGKDILVSIRDVKGKWSKPANLSSLVNSVYDEEGLFLSPDGNTLYFSSRGHNTMGGFDVFKTVKETNGTWSDPVNMGYPINTPDDELFFSFSDDGKAAYLSTIRDGGYGAKDIYKMVFLGSEKEMILYNEDILIAGLPDTKKTGFFTIPQPLSIDSFYILKGRVLNKANSEPIVAKLEFVDPVESKVAATAISNEYGEYEIKFSAAKAYGVEVIAKDFLFFLDVADMTNASADEPFIRDFLLDKIEVGTKVVLENIYFETGKATLTAASYPQLNQVITFLKNNETIRLEISGHTDNVGSAKVNIKLSDDRARAVVDYMAVNGIDRARLESKGYGFSQPVATNDTPAGREQNRRVEFKVISK